MLLSMSWLSSSLSSNSINILSHVRILVMVYLPTLYVILRIDRNNRFKCQSQLLTAKTHDSILHYLGMFGDTYTIHYTYAKVCHTALCCIRTHLAQWTCQRQYMLGAVSQFIYCLIFGLITLLDVNFVWLRHDEMICLGAVCAYRDFYIYFQNVCMKPPTSAICVKIHIHYTYLHPLPNWNSIWRYRYFNHELRICLFKYDILSIWSLILDEEILVEMENMRRYYII